MEQPHLSRRAYERLQAELAERTGPRRAELSERIARARELGDLSENADYDAAKHEQGLNEARIRQLEHVLRHAAVVEAADAEVAGPGTIVELLIDGDDEPQEYLLGSIEERHDHLEVLSTSSPIGRAVLGRKAGERTSYRTPRGVELEVEIVDIRPADGV